MKSRAGWAHYTLAGAGDCYSLRPGLVEGGPRSPFHGLVEIGPGLVDYGPYIPQERPNSITKRHVPLVAFGLGSSNEPYAANVLTGEGDCPSAKGTPLPVTGLPRCDVTMTPDVTSSCPRKFCTPLRSLSVIGLKTYSHRWASGHTRVASVASPRAPLAIASPLVSMTCSPVPIPAAMIGLELSSVASP